MAVTAKEINSRYSKYEIEMIQALLTQFSDKVGIVDGVAGPKFIKALTETIGANAVASNTVADLPAVSDFGEFLEKAHAAKEAGGTVTAPAQAAQAAQAEVAEVAAAAGDSNLNNVATVEKALGLKVDGKYDRAIGKALTEKVPGRGNRRCFQMIIQKKFGQDLGGDNGIDGVFGPKSTNALGAALKANPDLSIEQLAADAVRMDKLIKEGKTPQEAMDEIYPPQTIETPVPTPRPTPPVPVPETEKIHEVCENMPAEERGFFAQLGRDIGVITDENITFSDDPSCRYSSFSVDSPDHVASPASTPDPAPDGSKGSGPGGPGPGARNPGGGKAAPGN